jgi:hypothetical protein
MSRDLSPRLFQRDRFGRMEYQSIIALLDEPGPRRTSRKRRVQFNFSAAFRTHRLACGGLDAAVGAAGPEHLTSILRVQRGYAGCRLADSRRA